MITLTQNSYSVEYKYVNMGKYLDNLKVRLIYPIINSCLRAITIYHVNAYLHNLKYEYYLLDKDCK